jgi:hypothetical protein
LSEQQPEKSRGIPKKVRFWLAISLAVIVPLDLESAWYRETTLPKSKALGLMAPVWREITLPHRIGRPSPSAIGGPISSSSGGRYPGLSHYFNPTLAQFGGEVRIFPKTDAFCDGAFIILGGPPPKPKHYAWVPVMYAWYHGNWVIAYPFYMHPKLKIPKNRNYTVKIFPGQGPDGRIFTRVVLTLKSRDPKRR